MTIRTVFIGLALLALSLVTNTACCQNVTPQKGIHKDSIPAKGDKMKYNRDEFLKRIEQLNNDLYKKDMAALKEYEKYLDDLEKDGLIDRKKHFIIEHINGVLIIDTKIQPVEVYNRYRNFLEKYKAPRIKQDADGLLIQKD
jgi:hypothetical protein